MTELVATENPEEEELRRKKEELAVLENQLADLELEAAALLADTQAFLDTVTSAVAPTLLERDLLRAKLAEARLSQDPDNEEFVNQADTAREEARQAQQEYDAYSGSPGASDEKHRRYQDCSHSYRRFWQKTVLGLSGWPSPRL